MHRSFLRILPVPVIFAGAPAGSDREKRQRERKRAKKRKRGKSRRGWSVQKYARISPGRYANGILAVLLSQNHHTLTYLMWRGVVHVQRPGWCCERDAHSRRSGCTCKPRHADMHTHTGRRMRKLCARRVIDPRVKHSHTIALAPTHTPVRAHSANDADARWRRR